MMARLLSRFRDWSTLTFRRAGRSLPLSDVVAGASQGHARCVGELYRRYRETVLRVLTPLAPDDAEDLTQEVFLSLPAKLAGYEERGSFEAWLKQVAVNVHRTRRRAAERRREEELFDWMPAGTDPEMGRVTRNDLLERASDGMPESMLAAWKLLCEGYEAREIAALLEISPGAAATRLSRARDYLERRLKEIG